MNNKIELTSEVGATVVAKDEQERVYDYGKEGFPDSAPDIRAQDWFNVEPDTPWAND